MTGSSSLVEVLASFLPSASLSNPGASCKERGKSVSFRKEPGDIVCCLDLKAEVERLPDWPPGVPSCDCVFVCGREDRNDFLVVLVELKGDDTGRAMEQLRATARLLCKGSDSAFNHFGHNLAAKCGFPLRECPFSHGKTVLAVIACKSGGRASATWQDERKRLRTQKIKLLDRQDKQASFTVSQLFQIADRIK